MNSKQMNTSILQMFRWTTCQEIEDLIKSVSTGEYESQNATREDYLKVLRSPHCEPKPYPIAQGWKKWSILLIIILFLLFGLIGNSFSATIMFRRSRRGFSSYFYLALLAMIDICVLYTGCLLFFFEIAFNYHPQLHSTFVCRVVFYIQHLFTYISAWLIVAVTFERLIVVRFPFQSLHICRMHVGYTIAILIFAFFSFYTAHCFFTVKTFEINLQTDQGYHPNYRICDLGIHRRLLAFIDLCFYSVIPSIFILIFNILIIVAMFHALKQRRNYLQANSHTPTTDISRRNKQKSTSTIRTQFFRSRSAESTPAGRSVSQVNKQRICHSPVNQFSDQNKKRKVPADPTSSTGIRLTCLLLTISFIFVICTLPISIRSLIADYLPSQKSTTHWELTQQCLTLLMYFNHTINFVLYCLTGRTFRNECRKLLRSLCIWKDIQISCTTNPHANKHQHQQLIQINQNRFIPSQQLQRSYPTGKRIYQ